MSQVINTTVESALDAKRHEVVNTIIRGYGATKEYAELLFQYFPEDWYSFEHNDKDEAAKGILAEAQKFRDELRKGGHTNPSVVWTRVRQEGAKLAGLGESSEDGEGESSEDVGRVYYELASIQYEHGAYDSAVQALAKVIPIFIQTFAPHLAPDVVRQAQAAPVGTPSAPL